MLHVDTGRVSQPWQSAHVIRDEAAVGGFLEDLPVLVFVLLGVFGLVSTSVFASREMSEREDADRLGEIAQEILDSVLSGLNVGDSHGNTLTVSALRDLNLTGWAGSVACGAGFCVGISVLYPRAEWLSSVVSGDPTSANITGYARHLLVVTDDDGSTTVVEVKVLAW